MKKRVYLSIFLTSIVTLCIVLTMVILSMYSNTLTAIKKEVQAETIYVGSSIDNLVNSKLEYTTYLKKISTANENRITYIKKDGIVEYDSNSNELAMENHKNRPEFEEALSDGFGEDMRQSKTLGKQTYYYAVRLENQDVVRVAVTINGVFSTMSNSLIYIVLGILLLVVVTAFVAKKITKTIVKPINNLDLENPTINKTYDELSPLLLRIDKQNIKIKSQIEKIEAKQKEFDDVTENMSEALIIFGNNKNVIYANKTAKKLFDNYNIVDDTYLSVSRELEYIKAVENSFDGKKQEFVIRLNGRVYNISVTPVKDKFGYAAVLLGVDVTEKQEQEQMRREFSANVSHELKTPLTAIMGCAEIIQQGIVKPEDVPDFSKKIYDEAKRLLLLIQDIIKLSRLDEESLQNNTFENVDLSEIAFSVEEKLSLKAETNNVIFKTDLTEHCIVKGIKTSLYEMIYNLCDNAITYNKKDGNVIVTTQNKNGKIILTVEDTGIGIPKEDIERVFERFYRVDKSHSKETGGTGLGLSIVKHVALIHKAEIQIESEENKGTKITVIF